MITITTSLLSRPTAPGSNEIAVYARINLRSATERFKPIEISTRLKCEKKLWDQKAGRFKGKNPKTQSYNNRLTQFEADIIAAFNSCNGSGEFDLEDFKRIIGCKGAKAQKEFSISELFSECTKKKGNELGIKRHGRYDLVQIRFLDSLKTGNSGRNIKPQEITREDFLRFKNYLQAKNLSGNTIIGHLKILKAVFREAFNSKIIKEFPFNDCSTAYVKSQRQFLTYEELSRIESLPDLGLTPRQQLVRDLFIFQSYTGVAISDLTELQTDHLHTSLHGTMLVKNKCKTKEFFRAPLSEVPTRIIEKYKEQAKPKNRLFWVPCIKDYNRDLQIIRHLAKIEKPLISHIARHTMACMYLQGGGSIYTLASILGHSNVRTTQIYGKLQDHGMLSEARQVFKNLSNRDAEIIPINRLLKGGQDGSARQANTR
ncbi:MAG: hypothetical protein EOO10_14360 [Chitinophagaceae bacterium]|nr:MAG: hypothetical protein EOO10_14360 [Chitinophagaceae bacterium]